MNQKLLVLLAALGPFQGALAGTVVFDNTLPGQHGAPTPLTPAEGTYTIDSVSGYLTGTNLFHSFLSFSIDSGQTALFTNSLQAPIGNVLARVTGGSPSIINGTITSQIFLDPGTNKTGANFWFINPAGVTFGKGAAVNVPAGFAVGAADYLSFADGSRFYALPSNGPQPAVFTTASPAAFGFLATPASGAVILQGNNITTTGPITLSAGAGGISLSNSSLQTTNTNAATGPGLTISTNAGPVTLQTSTLAADTTGGGPAGDVNVASGSTLSLQNSSVLSETFSFGNAGNITLSSSAAAGGAGALTITGGLIATRPNPSAQPMAGKIGAPGHVAISGPSVYISGATIESTSKGFPSAGTVSITGSGADSGPAGGGAADAVFITGATTIASINGDNHAGAIPGGITVQAPAGSVRIDAGSTLAANSSSSGVPTAGPVTVFGKTALTLDNTSISANSTFNLASASDVHSDISLQSSGPISLSNGASVTSRTAAAYVASDNISIDTPAAVTLSGNSTLTTQGEPVGSVTVKGGSIHVTGGSISVLGIGQNGASSAPAGDLTLEATGADGSSGVAALLIDGGAQITGDTRVGQAGSISLQADTGTVSLVGTPALATTITSSAHDFGYAGTVTLAGNNVSLNGATVQTTQAIQELSAGAGPATIAVSASGNVGLVNSVLDARTSGSMPAGNIKVNGSSVSVSGGSLSASTVGIAAAGSVSITATGAQGVNGAAALQISDGASVASDASGGGTPRANAGSVTLTAPAGTVQVGLSTDTTPSSLSTASGSLGAPGQVTITGAGVSLGNAKVLTTTINTEPSATRGTITLNAGGGAGPLSVSNSSLDAATSGVQQAGEIDLLGAPISISNSTISSKTTGTGSAGAICVGTPGCVAAGSTVPATGGAISISGSTLTTSTSSTGAAGDIQVNGASVSVSGGQLTASTTGTGNAGNVSLTATGASGASNAAALQVSDGASINSDASGGASPDANAGYVSLSAPAGTVQVGLSTDTGASSLSSQAGANAGAPGTVTIAGAAIALGDAKLSTTAAGAAPSTTRGTIVLDAGGGSGSLSITHSSLDAATSGVQQAGEIDLLGSPISINNTIISSATTGTGPAGAICVTTGSGCGTRTSSAGKVRPADKLLAAAAPAAGDISISGSTLSTSTSTSGNAGDITVIAPGALTLSDTSVTSQSTSPAPNAGSVGIITLIGGSVGILDGSAVSAESNGGMPGAVGGPAAAITITGTDGTTPLLISNSTVSTTARVVNGSNIVVNAGGSPVEIAGGVLTASATAGNGGNITINDAGNTTLAQGEIVAQAGPGNGGAINIQLKPGAVFVQDARSLVSATSQTGNNGTVSINSPQTDLNSALRVPEVSVARPPELAANVCKHDASHSTFVREGHGGVAPGPDAYRTGHVIADAPETGATQSQSGTDATSNIPVLLSSNRPTGCR